MATGFLNGLVSGFMSMGGGGAMAGAGGGAGSTAGTASAGAGQGMTGGTPGSKSTPSSAMGGGESIGKTSQALSGDSGGSSGGIIRDNPYGSGSASSSSPTGLSPEQKQTADYFKQMGGGASTAPHQQFSTPSLTSANYNAMFGSSGGGHGAVLNMPNLVPSLPVSQVGPRPQMQIPVSLPQPMPMGQLMMSDANSKYNIYKANPIINQILETAYNNIVSRRK